MKIAFEADQDLVNVLQEKIDNLEWRLKEYEKNQYAIDKPPLICSFGFKRTNPPMTTLELAASVEYKENSKSHVIIRSYRENGLSYDYYISKQLMLEKDVDFIIIDMHKKLIMEVLQKHKEEQERL